MNFVNYDCPFCQKPCTKIGFVNQCDFCPGQPKPFFLHNDRLNINPKEPYLFAIDFTMPKFPKHYMAYWVGLKVIEIYTIEPEYSYTDAIPVTKCIFELSMEITSPEEAVNLFERLINLKSFI